MRRDNKKRKDWVPLFLLMVKYYGAVHLTTDFSAFTQLLLTTKRQNEKSVAIKDIDETLMIATGYDSTERQLALGSSSWFNGMVQQLPREAADYRQRFLTLLAYYFAIQAHVNYALTEPCVSDELNALKQNNIAVLGLTARSAPIAEITVQHLEKQGIQFTFDSDDRIVLDVQKHANAVSPIYYKGIVFCAGLPKDECLEAFLKTSVGAALFDGVKRVSFMDDQRKYCDSIHRHLRHNGFFPVVAHYTHAEENIPCASQLAIEENMQKLAQDKGLAL